MFVIPVSTQVLDTLLIINIATSLIILLTTMYVKSPLDLSSFPTIILIATLFRLVLNLTSTRLILSSQGNAGNVIKTFGNFVIKGNPVVGLIIFLIIVIIQFIVITKGSERVSEVSARFTLDSMPGKQMAIDADLNAGLINETQAKERREQIQREADFYGSMDGASKFVKGDAIAGILITFVNLVGGMIIGLVISKQPFNEVVNVYTLASVGDGLVSQIPALLISTASGIILTRKASSDTLNTELIRQLFSQSIVLFIGGATLIFMVFIPGLPKLPLTAVGSILLFLGYQLYSKQSEPIPVSANAAPIMPKIEEYDITEYIFTDPIVVEFGYSLVSLIDKQQGGKLLDRLVMIRRQMVLEWGLILPKIRVKDNHSLMPNQYCINVKGFRVASGEILPDYFMAMNSDEYAGDLDGIETTEPTYGIPAVWIRPEELDRAEMQGYTVVDAVSVIATHISKIIVDHSHNLLGLEEVKELVKALERRYPALVESIMPDIITLRTLQKVLCNLLEDGVKIKNLPKILEILGDYGRTVADAGELTEFVRQGLKKEICEKYIFDSKIDLIVINPDLEKRISDTLVTRSPDGNILKHEELKQFIQKSNEEYNSALDQGYNPVVITTPTLRTYLKDLFKQNRCDIDVLSVLEIDEMCDIKIVGNINI